MQAPTSAQYGTQTSTVIQDASNTALPSVETAQEILKPTTNDDLPDYENDDPGIGEQRHGETGTYSPDQTRTSSPSWGASPGGIRANRTTRYPVRYEICEV